MIRRNEFELEDLHAFIDDELDSDRREAIAKAAAQDFELAKKIALFRADKSRLATTYGHLADRPLPAEWRSRIESYGSGVQRRSYMQPLLALAATLLLMAAIGIGYWQHSRPAGDTIIAEAFAARSQSTQPNVVLAVNSAPDRRTADGLIAKALKMKVKAPDLGKMGYVLAGLRTYNGVLGGKAVELIYRGTNNRDLALYVRHSSGQVRFDQFKQDGVRVCIWQDDVIGTVITGKMSAAEMQRLASLAYRGLET